MGEFNGGLGERIGQSHIVTRYTDRKYSVIKDQQNAMVSSTDMDFKR